MHATCLLLYFVLSRVFIELFMFTEAWRDWVIVIFDWRWRASIIDLSWLQRSWTQTWICFRDAACNEKSRALEVCSTSRLDYNIQENVKPSNLLKAPFLWAETNRLPSRKTTIKKEQLWASSQFTFILLHLCSLIGIGANFYFPPGFLNCTKCPGFGFFSYLLEVMTGN